MGGGGGELTLRALCASVRQVAADKSLRTEIMDLALVFRAKARHNSSGSGSLSMWETM